MIGKPEHVIEIFLQPGEFYFGDDSTRIRTLLGSCVSITMWHSTRRIGGMCHYMLPSRGGQRTKTPDGRYADEAMRLFLCEIVSTGTDPAEYEVKLFGGGNMFAAPAKRNGDGPEMIPGADLSQRNIEVGRHLLTEHGFHIKAESVGGKGRRNIIFDIWSGDVWVRQRRDTLDAAVASAGGSR